MTRANLNFISQNTGEAPKTLYFYWNGDQYPEGIRDIYHLLDFIKAGMKEDDFREWAKKNYEGVKIKSITQPKIYYTDGFITDYSYVFDYDTDRVLVYNWADKIFDGKSEEFIKWLEKYPEE
jgi:hypothetical protein